MAEYISTTATQKIAAMKKRLRCVQGGTSASKTISILLFLIDECQTDETPKITSIVSESFPHLRKGSMRDFLAIMEAHDYFQEARWDRTNSVYTFESGSKIEFFSVEQSDKVRGPRRDRLFINEANNIGFETFNQLEIRTKDYIFLDWNPSSEFWFYTDILGQRTDVNHIILTYKDNEALDPQIIKSIEQRKNNKQWWQVYGLGQLGTVEGRIYKDWQIIDEVPHEAKLVSYGLDFGFTNDPAVIVAAYAYNGGYIFDEIVYAKGLHNKQLADVLLSKDRAMVIADAAEPKSIDEIKLYQVPIMPSTKGKGSVKARIDFVQAQRISITKQSVNVIKDYRNYLWDTDDDGRTINIPQHPFSHGMDACGYALLPRMDILSKSNDTFKKGMAWEQPAQPKQEIFPSQTKVAGRPRNSLASFGPDDREEYGKTT